ncbi:hypothetical protein FRC11_010825, partial [Ceratobasidium sp. 423]
EFAGNSSESGPDLTGATKDKLITRLTEQLEQKDIQLERKNIQLAARDRVIHEQRREILQKEQEISRVNEEFDNALVYLAQRNASVKRVGNLTVPENHTQNEVTTLREKVARLESLLNRWLDEDNKSPNVS